ncbi:MAG: putative alpha,2-mannosidase [Edaphobacter sp.]|nr:putative alpha,2-mannosidase [Edaphobacter sp.]
MVSRRNFLGGVSAASMACFVRDALALPASLQPFLGASSGDGSDVDATKLVKTAIGTGGHGHTYPGATMPFGAVQLSPDTGIKDWDHCSGYHYADSSILGFSHTHLSGTGCADLLDVLLMPATDDFKFDPHAKPDSPTSYRSRFSHSDEESVPGYYRVYLQDSKVKAELTATERTGIHRYTFPKSDNARFLLDLAHAGGAGVAATEPAVRWSSLSIVGNDTIVGGRCTDLWAKGRQVYFSMKFSKPFESAEVYSDGNLVGAASGEIKGKSLRCILKFKTNENEVILVKTGISGVSIDGAAGNLKAETPGWDFDGTRAAAHAAWRKELGRIHVSSDDQKYLEIFYTGLYHMMVAPTLFDDVDGQYRGMDGKVYTLAKGTHNYSTFSLWDTYRAAHPMYTLILGDRVPDFVNCLIRMAEQSPAGVPVWPLQGSETGTMVGYHSAPVVAEALAKGFRGIDAKAAYAPFKKRAMVDDYRGLAAYRKLGYVPCDEQEESASKTLDYAYDDRAVAALAKSAGEDADCTLLMKRSRSFVNLYDKESGFIRPKYSDGRWASPFNPKSIKITKWRDYTEANAWQTTFCVQHDPALLIETLGGKKPFIDKLDELFNQSSEMPPDMPPDVTGMVGQYAHGNEPSHHIAYLYNYAGVPHKTQARVRSLMETMYDNKPNGMAGNEDCGQMSAWFVISSMGLYAVDPVSAKYDFGTPLFDRVELTVAGNRKLTIEAKRDSPKSIYVQSVEWNGSPLKSLAVEHAQLVKGGHLVFHLSDAPLIHDGAQG